MVASSYMQVTAMLQSSSNEGIWAKVGDRAAQCHLETSSWSRMHTWHSNALLNWGMLLKPYLNNCGFTTARSISARIAACSPSKSGWRTWALKPMLLRSMGLKQLNPQPHHSLTEQWIRLYIWQAVCSSGINCLHVPVSLHMPDGPDIIRQKPGLSISLYASGGSGL